jgi:glycosyltransferase involved in cell wall biosynthesis
VKIPEATACRRAVVATEKAARGLELFADDEIIRTKAVDEGFVAAVLRLMEDPGLRSAVGARAEARTRKEFDWDKTLGAYEDFYAKIGALAS